MQFKLYAIHVGVAFAADVGAANAAPLQEVPPPVQTHKKAPEQAYYKPPVDRNPVIPPRGADLSSIMHASQQPLPRSDSDNIRAAEAPHGAAHARPTPFVQQQQNKQQVPVSHAHKPGRAPAQQAQQRPHVGQGRGQAGTVRDSTPPRLEHRAAPAPEAASAGWTCPICTYRHEGKQAGFLACAICGGVRKET